MDVYLIMQGSDSWLIRDPLGHSLGKITTEQDGRLLVRPDVGMPDGMSCGPFVSLDLVMVAIERHTKGVCQVLNGRR